MIYNTFYYLLYEERLTFHLVDTLDILEGEVHLQIVGKHSCVQFSYDNILVATENIECVLRHRVDITELSECCGMTGGIKLFASGVAVSYTHLTLPTIYSV